MEVTFGEGYRNWSVAESKAMPALSPCSEPNPEQIDCQ